MSEELRQEELESRRQGAEGKSGAQKVRSK